MGIPWLFMLARQASAHLAAALETPVPLLQEEAGLAGEPHAPVRLRSRGSGTPVELPWLSVVGGLPRAWPAARDIQNASGQADSARASWYREGRPALKVGYVEPANWAGLPIFTDALAKDVDPQLAQALAACPTLAQNGCSERSPRCNLDHPQSTRKRVWIVVQTENFNGEQYWKMLKRHFGPHDKAVLLGPWWNAAHENFTNRNVISIWLPYASASFGMHKQWTPMDLWDRSRRNFKAPRPYLVAYQNRHCVQRRETYWDSLNQVMNRSEELRGKKKGYYLAWCNGNLGLGEHIAFPHINASQGLGYDESVHRYQHFKFILSAENSKANRTPNGYITEKIVNAYLAGAVPIYWGVSFAQLEQIFLPGTYIRVDTEDRKLRELSLQRFLTAAEDPSKYELLLHRKGPLVTNASMQRFFSWHPAVWPHFGDGLRQDILHAALKLCQS